MFIFEREREREIEEQKEGDTESEEAGSRLWTVSTKPHMGLELMDWKIMTWTKVGHLTNWANQAPQNF